MSVLHDTVPGYGFADKLKVELTTARDAKAFFLFGYQALSESSQDASRSSIESLASCQTSFFLEHAEILGGQSLLPRICVRRAARELLVALLYKGGSWRLFTQLSPFHGCLPRMERPKYGAGELRQQLAAGLHACTLNRRQGSHD